MDPGFFDRVLSVLVDQGLADDCTTLGLYNWGEPFLHPDLNEILAISRRKGVPVSLSTNASRLPLMSDNFSLGLKSLIISMPGFSQDSYDRIHGFAFADIVKNILALVDGIRRDNPACSIAINFHVYQFNLLEIAACDEFCRQNGIGLQLHYAILNNWVDLWAYVENTLPYHRLKEISQDLFSFPLRSLPPGGAEGYRCPQYDLLAIDEEANVLLCCQVPRGAPYVAGNLFRDDINVIMERRMSSPVCKKCIHTGMARYLNSGLEFPLELFLSRPQKQFAEITCRSLVRRITDMARQVYNPFGRH